MSLYCICISVWLSTLISMCIQVRSSASLLQRCCPYVCFCVAVNNMANKTMTKTNSDDWMSDLCSIAPAPIVQEYWTHPEYTNSKPLEGKLGKWLLCLLDDRELTLACRRKLGYAASTYQILKCISKHFYFKCLYISSGNQARYSFTFLSFCKMWCYVICVGLQVNLHTSTLLTALLWSALKEVQCYCFYKSNKVKCKLKCVNSVKISTILSYVNIRHPVWTMSLPCLSQRSHNF